MGDGIPNNSKYDCYRIVYIGRLFDCLTDKLICASCADSSADRRADGGVDRHARMSDERAVRVVTATRSAAAAALHVAHARHAPAPDQAPRTQARTVTPLNSQSIHRVTMTHYCSILA